jgi:hypothetical protein
MTALVVGNCLLIIITALTQTFGNKYLPRGVLSVDCRSRVLARARCPGEWRRRQLPFHETSCFEAQLC